MDSGVVFSNSVRGFYVSIAACALRRYSESDNGERKSIHGKMEKRHRCPKSNHARDRESDAAKPKPTPTPEAVKDAVSFACERVSGVQGIGALPPVQTPLQAFYGLTG